MKISMKQVGVTLLELMIVVAIVAIFAAIGIPSMTDMVRTNRVSSARISFISDLNLARSEAIKRNTRVLICSGQADCVNNADWARTGWIICVDANRDGACDAATAAEPNPFLVRAPLQSDINLVGPAAAVIYNSIGSQGVSPAGTISFTLNGSWTGAAAAKSLSVGPTGLTTTH